MVRKARPITKQRFMTTNYVTTHGFNIYCTYDWLNTSVTSSSDSPSVLPCRTCRVSVVRGDGGSVRWISAVLVRTVRITFRDIAHLHCRPHPIVTFNLSVLVRHSKEMLLYRVEKIRHSCSWHFLTPTRISASALIQLFWRRSINIILRVVRGFQT